MRVQHDDMRVWVVGQNGGQHQRDGAGFSRASRSQDREIFRQQLVYQHKGWPSRIMEEASDTDVGSRWPGINRCQIGCGCGSDGSARNRMAGYASMELAPRLARGADLPQQVDDQKNTCCRVELSCADRSDDIEIGTLHFDHGADADGSVGKPIRGDLRSHLRTGHRHDPTEYVVHSVSSSMPELPSGSLFAAA